MSLKPANLADSSGGWGAAGAIPGPFALGPHPIGTASLAAGNPLVDPLAVENARREIQSLAREVAELAKSDIEPEAFYEALLSRVARALGAVGGAVWAYDAEGALRLACQTNFQQARIEGETATQQHSRLLQAVAGGAAEMLYPPHSSSGGDSTAANPSEFLLVLGAMASDEGVQGVLEIIQRPGTSATSQRGYARFVRQMCELAGDYLRARRLRQFAHKQSLWDQLEQFAQDVHASLDIRRTAYTIANEGRRVIGCDRVSLALRHGRKCRLEAVSGQDELERRSNIVARLETLARAVAATGEALWYTGERVALAPQIERALDGYLDLSHAKLVAVLPLLAPAEGNTEEIAAASKAAAKGKLLGVLVVEQLSDSQPGEGMPRRAEAVARHGGSALANALVYHSLFLLPLWRALGKMRWLVRARTLPKTLLAAALVGGGAASLVLVPADFTLESRGTLQPSVRREVFAGIDGVVIEVPVVHGQMVAAGETLARLRNTDLEVQITDVLGRREATGKQIRAVERALLGESKLSVEEQNRLSGQLLQLRKTYESLDRQLDLYRKKEAQLVVASEIAGQVVTWQVHDQLIRRPVRQGQILMSVADSGGPWELELHMPEDRMGHIAQAARERGAPLEVEYVLATDPGTPRWGRVSEIHAAAEVRGDEGNTVLVRVAIDKSELADLRPGASVTAKVACGQRSLGYVWLHDLIAFVQRKILFRL